MLHYQKIYLIALKPQQNVDAEIITKTLTNVKYIERPANIKAQSALSLYQLSPQRNSAILTNIKFGEKTGRYIEILSAVKVGDQIIISDLSNYKAKVIAIN